MIRQVALMGEAGFGCDAADRQLPFPQQHLRPVDAPLNYVLMYRQSNRFAKGGLDVRDADTRYRGQFLERKVFGQVVLDVADHLLKLRSQAALIGLRWGHRRVSSVKM